MSEDSSNHASEEINRLLLSAGYFRVRMLDLDAFDKVAGGLSWALKASSVDVNVDIFFKEKPNIGEKIRISDSICKALRSSGCPYNLTPHQIQGLDFPQIFPVVQWLVKKVIATREEFGDFQRSYAEFSFNNKYANLPSDVLLKEHSGVSKLNIRQMKKYYPPKRYYKRNDWNLNDKNELKEIETTLLEYGKIPSFVAKVSGKETTGSPHEVSQTLGQKIKEQRQNEQDDGVISEERNRELKQTLSNMQKQTEEDEGIDSSIITGIMSRNEEIAAAHSIFEAQKFDLEVSVTETELREKHEHQMQGFVSQLSNVKAKGRKVNELYTKNHEKLEELTEQYQEQKEKNITLKNSIKKYNEIINQSRHSEDLMRAIAVRDDTLKDVEDFTKQCQEEIKEWQQKIDNLKSRIGTNDVSSSDDRLSSTLEQYEQEWERKQKLIAEKARKVLKLRTEYDQIPTMAELAQYDRKLNELGSQSLHEVYEHKKRNELYNALTQSQSVLEKENELFNSILKSFNQAIAQPSLQKNLLNQMSEISRQTSMQKEKVLAELEKKREELSKLDEQHRKLLENQRRYFQAVKEYQLAYDKLESLRGDEEEE